MGGNGPSRRGSCCMTRLSPRRFVGIAASVSVAVRRPETRGTRGDSPAGGPAQSMSLLRAPMADSQSHCRLGSLSARHRQRRSVRLVRSRGAGSGGSRGAPRSPAAARDHAGPGDGAAAMRTRGGDRRREQRRAAWWRARRWRRNPRVAGSGGGGTARIECGPGARRRTGSG